MRSISSSSTPNYAADIDNVKEVTLHGTADLSFWEAVLQKENLFPYHEADKAVLLLSAIDAKWRRFNFREFVIAVGVCLSENGASLDGYYLPRAFNSSKFLAFSERTFFRRLTFKAISNLIINSLLLSNWGTGQRFSLRQKSLFRTHLQ